MLCTTKVIFHKFVCQAFTNLGFLLPWKLSLVMVVVVVVVVVAAAIVVVVIVKVRDHPFNTL
jgi:hypothetical protein